MAQAPLITPQDILQRSGLSAFLSQFIPRPLVLSIVTGGTLGTMQFQWQQQGDPSFSAVFTPEAGASWSMDLDDPGFGTLTFPTGTYVVSTTYIVSAIGLTASGLLAVTVTPGPGALAGVSAVRFAPLYLACEGATSKAVTWLLPRVVPPIISVPSAIKEWIADVAIYDLKSRQGMTPDGAGAGDDNIRMRAETAQRELQRIGGSEDRPPDLVDSSQGNIGAGFPAFPIGDDLRGW